MAKTHSFHIPVMGIGYTIDTPLKVSQYGINSVISLVDDILMEKLRKMYCNKFGIPYQEISEKVEDYRAKRITSYLNMINAQAEKKFNEIKNATNEKANELKKYFNLLPDNLQIKSEFKSLTSKCFNINEIRTWIKDNISMGSIDVNIMTKLDKENYKGGLKLSPEYSDAQAALRGFALSDLKSSLVLSAGMNPRLFSSIEQYDDFYPDGGGNIKKQIVIKVSDYRSALIQGKIFAKKGIWVSEYRIESGLNCGGHAFATEGNLIGPILEEFKNKRNELEESLYELLTVALEEKGKEIPSDPLSIRITGQGGVGTSDEHQFLLDYYKLDSVGWGTPFMLVPEAISIDKPTVEKLCEATEEDLYLSNISPMGVPFNNLRGNSKDLEKEENIKTGKPGSNCPKLYLSSNTEFSEKAICTASRSYQKKKIAELDSLNLSEEEYKINFNNIVEKSCICVGLGTSALIINNIDTKTEGKGISVCPGPNMAYFSKTMSIKDICDHIYGRANFISRKDRPNMFLKELNLYIDNFKNKIDNMPKKIDRGQRKYLINSAKNIEEGIKYYKGLFENFKNIFDKNASNIASELESSSEKLQQYVKKFHIKIA